MYSSSIFMDELRKTTKLQDSRFLSHDSNTSPVYEAGVLNYSNHIVRSEDVSITIVIS